MPKFRLQMDGKTYDVDAPDEATALQGLGLHGGGQSTPVPPASPANKNPVTPEGTQMQGDIPGGAAGAFVAKAGHELFGLGDAAGSLAHMMTDSRHIGYKQAHDEYMAAMQVGQDNHPVAATAGTIAGGADAAVLTAPLAGGAAGALTKAVPALRGVSMAAGAGRGLAGNLARMGVQGGVSGAVTGAAVGAGQGAATGDPGNIIPQAAGGAVAGGAAGAVLAPATGLVAAGARKVIPQVASRLGQVAPSLNDRVANTLSKLFDERPGDIKATYDAHMAAKGAPPTMAELADYKQRGLIASAAKNSGAINEALGVADNAQAAARAENFQAQATQTPGQAGPTPPTTPGAAENVTGAQGDIDYGHVRQQTFQVPGFGAEPVPGEPPSAYEVVRNGILPHTTLTASARQTIANELGEGYLSGNSVDLIRRNLMERARAKPGEGFSERAEDFLDLLHNEPGNEAGAAALNLARGNYAANASRAAGAAQGVKVAGGANPQEFAAQVDGRTAGTVPGYQPTPEQAAATSNFAAGADQGARSALAAQGGNPVSFDGFVRRLASDTNLQKNVATASGQDYADALTNLAKQEAARSEASAAVSSRASPDADKGTAEAVNKFAHLAATVGSHGVFYKVLHGARWALGDTIPDNVANVAAKYLADPKMVTQGLNILRKSGASNADLARVMLHSATLAGVAGGVTGAAVAGQ